MKHIANKIITILAFITGLFAVATPVMSQELSDSLTRLPDSKFEAWLNRHNFHSDKINDTIIANVILRRLDNKNYMADQVLISYLNNRCALKLDARMVFMDTLIKYFEGNPYMCLNLLSMKSELLFQMPLLNTPKYLLDSIKSDTYDKIEKMDQLIIDLRWLEYNNYLNQGNFYLERSDFRKAEVYFIRLLKLEFYSYERSADVERFKDLYVGGAIGRIKCNGDNYTALSQMVFAPAAMPLICPVLSQYIKMAGGEGENCNPPEGYYRRQ